MDGGEGRGWLWPGVDAARHGYRGSKRRDTVGALLLLLSSHGLKTPCLLPHLLRVRSMLQVSSGVKPGQHRSTEEGAEHMRQKMTLDILFLTKLVRLVNYNLNYNYNLRNPYTQGTLQGN